MAWWCCMPPRRVPQGGPAPARRAHTHNWSSLLRCRPGFLPEGEEQGQEDEQQPRKMEKTERHKEQNLEYQHARTLAVGAQRFGRRHPKVDLVLLATTSNGDRVRIAVGSGPRLGKATYFRPVEDQFVEQSAGKLPLEQKRRAEASVFANDMDTARIVVNFLEERGITSTFQTNAALAALMAGEPM